MSKHFSMLAATFQTNQLCEIFAECLLFTEEPFHTGLNVVFWVFCMKLGWQAILWS